MKIRIVFICLLIAFFVCSFYIYKNDNKWDILSTDKITTMMKEIESNKTLKANKKRNKYKEKYFKQISMIIKGVSKRGKRNLRVSGSLCVSYHLVPPYSHIECDIFNNPYGFEYDVYDFDEEFEKEYVTELRNMGYVVEIDNLEDNDKEFNIYW